VRRRLAPVALAALVAALGCASTDITGRDEYRGAKLPRPGRILVHDFAASAADLPAWSEERAHFSEGAATAEVAPDAETLDVQRKLGTEVAQRLVEQIGAMGLPAVRAAGQPDPREGDLVLIGAFTSVDEGSRLKRVVIGFGSGAAELKTHVAGYRMADGHLHKLGSGDTASGGGKGPGTVVPAIVTVATANPIGLIVGGVVKAEGELSGRSTVEGTAKRTADKIADELRVKFEEQGWIREP